ncbi:hypothetical protein [Amycolatopsis jejuensis]|uniref:hypothetical protein n=1 Tax=Amycolatopsis jejuensis TaxID=330084 RepID=UPI00068AC486|nr:hypothetical protein [Amycolatopsis jejuensis]
MSTKPPEKFTLDHVMVGQVTRIVNDIRIPRPFSINGLIERLNRQRDKPIRLMRGNLNSAMPTGMVVRTATADYIVVIRDILRGHARHIHFHELGHLLLEDAGVAGRCSSAEDPEHREIDEAIAEEFAHQLAERVDANVVTDQLPQAALNGTFAAARDLRGVRA